MSFDLPSLKRVKTTKDYVYEALLDAIFSGSIRDDVVLTEMLLAEKFGVSRTPVREAIQDLEREGVLEPAGARGKRVHTLESAEIEELFWLRRAIEGAAVVRLASRRLEDEQLARLDEIMEQQTLAYEKDDRRAFLEYDDILHKALAEYTGYPRALEIMANIRLLFQLTGLRAVAQPNRLSEVLEEHRAVVTAIKASDPERAKHAMEAHLRSTEQVVLEQPPRHETAVEEVSGA